MKHTLMFCIFIAAIIFCMILAPTEAANVSRETCSVADIDTAEDLQELSECFSWE